MGKARRKRAERAAASLATPTLRPSAQTSAFRRMRTLALSVIQFLAIFVGARELLAEAYHIPSGSMEPTLQVGDWLWVNKLRFGPHIPFTNYSLPGYAAPKRGDIAVFISPPQDPSIRISPDDVTPLLVKRVVGLAGDTLLMRHGQLMVNGTAVASPNEFVLPDSLSNTPQAIFAWQHSIEIRNSRFDAPVESPSLHEWGPLVVPAGHYFMMGDNRDNSVDSRYYGPVPRANLRGRPTFIYYSYDPEQGHDFIRALTAIRWKRLGHWVD